MATAHAPALRWRNDRLFYTSMGIYLAVLTFAGFAPSFYLSRWMTAPATTPEMTRVLYLHGIVFTGWILLNVIQPALIAANNRRLHRRVGYAGAVIAALMVVFGNIAAIAAMDGGFKGFGDPFAFYAIPFFAIQTFAVIVILAIVWRNKAETHKRLMLLSSTQIIEAAIARMPLAATGAPFSFFVGADSVIILGIAYDLVSRGKVHKVWIWGGGLVVVSQIVRLMISQTGPWLDFAHYMAGLW
jgi:hypothetical protein